MTAFNAFSKDLESNANMVKQNVKDDFKSIFNGAKTSEEYSKRIKSYLREHTCLPLLPLPSLNAYYQDLINGYEIS